MKQRLSFAKLNEYEANDTRNWKEVAAANKNIQREAYHAQYNGQSWAIHHCLTTAYIARAEHSALSSETRKARRTIQQGITGGGGG